MALHPAFADLVPHGVVQCGSTIACVGDAAMSLALAVAAGPTQQGAWLAVAGLPALGLRATVEAGVALERLVLVAGTSEQQWGDVLAAMIDGFDVILLGPAAQRIRPGIARRLLARLHSRGAVLITVGHSDAFGSDLQFVAAQSHWDGLGQGHGVATARRVRVELRGRRVPNPRRHEMWFPTTAGQPTPVIAAAEAPAPDIVPAVVPSIVADTAELAPLQRTG